MVQRIVTQWVDDMTGEEIAEGQGETISFALDGTAYTIDLTAANADRFRGLFQDYIAVASKVGRTTSTRRAASSSGPSAKELREWARSQGLEVPERGRIPASVREAFEAAD